MCHRLTTLRKPGANGVAFHFVRVDIAGNISKRFSGTGIRFARFSGSCPRWDVHAAFLTPGRIRTQFSQMPDGTAYFCVARTIRKSFGYASGDALMAVGIGCPVKDARKLVYADGYNLDNMDAAVPIGTTCRLCERVDCEQRAFPADAARPEGRRERARTLVLLAGRCAAVEGRRPETRAWQALKRQVWNRYWSARRISSYSCESPAPSGLETSIGLSSGSRNVITQ